MCGSVDVRVWRYKRSVANSGAMCMSVRVCVRKHQHPWIGSGKNMCQGQHACGCAGACTGRFVWNSCLNQHVHMYVGGCINMYVYVYTYTYLRTCIYIYVHTHMHTSTHNHTTNTMRLHDCVYAPDASDPSGFIFNRKPQAATVARDPHACVFEGIHAVYWHRSIVFGLWPLHVRHRDAGRTGARPRDHGNRRLHGDWYGVGIARPRCKYVGMDGVSTVSNHSVRSRPILEPSEPYDPVNQATTQF